MGLIKGCCYESNGLAAPCQRGRGYPHRENYSDILSSWSLDFQFPSSLAGSRSRSCHNILQVYPRWGRVDGISHSTRHWQRFDALIPGRHRVAASSTGQLFLRARYIMRAEDIAQRDQDRSDAVFGLDPMSRVAEREFLE